MSSSQLRSEPATETPRARTVDMKLEVVVIPVSDVDRAKSYYSDLGWRLDADFAAGARTDGPRASISTARLSSASVAP
jgi:bleomycin resistance family protein